MEATQQIIRQDGNLFADVCTIIEAGRTKAYASVNATMIETYWNIGKRIVEEEQQGKERAKYGEHVLECLSSELTTRYGKGFSARYLRSFRKFYLILPDYEIWKSRFPNLTWTHIFYCLRADSDVATRWYLEMTSQEMWSVRTLSRNIGTQYFERHFRQPQLPMKEEHPDKLEMLKSPIIAEFLGFKQDNSFSEQEFETAIINHLQDFIMELGRGFAFMARQQLFQAKYMPYLPTEEVLRREIEQQKELFLLQQKEAAVQASITDKQ